MEKKLKKEAIQEVAKNIEALTESCKKLSSLQNNKIEVGIGNSHEEAYKNKMVINDLNFCFLVNWD